MKVLIDTNVLFGAILYPNRLCSKAFDICARNGWLVIPVYVVNEMKYIIQNRSPHLMPYVNLFSRN